MNNPLRPPTRHEGAVAHGPPHRGPKEPPCAPYTTVCAIGGRGEGAGPATACAVRRGSGQESGVQGRKSLAGGEGAEPPGRRASCDGERTKASQE